MAISNKQDKCDEARSAVRTRQATMTTTRVRIAFGDEQDEGDEVTATTSTVRKMTQKG